MSINNQSVELCLVPVAIPGEKPYDVAIGTGLLPALHQQLQSLFNGRSYRPFLITSPNIWALWSEQVRASFPEARSPKVLFLPSGEKHKRLPAVEDLAEQLAEAGADRDALLIAFGGGVIGDITGFLAAIYMRGVPYVQIPTTLLAQVDSSVGGKTGVNLAAGKNLIGSFNHPLTVLADTGLLGTLPARELRSGLQEAVKAAVIHSTTFFEYLERHKVDIRNAELESLAHVVRKSVEIKAEVVVADEREAGRRMILNFGHTLGHAIESVTEYRELLHGEAVAWGSIGALHLGLARGSITHEQFDRISQLILAFGPLPRFQTSAERLVERSASDKKMRSGRRAFVLPTGIGQVEIVHDVTDAELLVAADAMMQTMKKAGEDL
ncbi:MAG: 3-dehydroquinate synthase [Janthinobacterium lividum]